MKVPKMATGQSYTEYLAEVKLWRQLSSIPKTEQAYALIMELPTTDKFGGLRQILVNRLKPEIINHEDGVNRMITELDRIISHHSSGCSNGMNALSGSPRKPRNLLKVT